MTPIWLESSPSWASSLSLRDVPIGPHTLSRLLWHNGHLAGDPGRESLQHGVNSWDCQTEVELQFVAAVFPVVSESEIRRRLTCLKKLLVTQRLGP